MLNKIDNNFYYREYDLCSKYQIENIKQDIDFEIASGRVAEPDEKQKKLNIRVPKYQTYTDLYLINKHKKHWSVIYNKIKKSAEKFTKASLNLRNCWANISTPLNNYDNHKHTTFITCVYYLKSTYPHYGTFLTKEKIIFPATENSLLIFKGNIEHSVSNVPKHLYKNIDDTRYSVVFDFDKK
jgi:hypothetical protein